MSKLVKNVNGSSRWEKPSTGESSWLEYWENQTGKIADHCGCCRTKYNLVGAHVQLDHGDNKVYITPLCAACNNQTGNFYVDTDLAPVPSRL